MCSPVIRKGLDDVGTILDWILYVDCNLPMRTIASTAKTGRRIFAMRTWLMVAAMLAATVVETVAMAIVMATVA